jgi:hypothetical protein
VNERNYQFRQKLNIVHKPDRRDYALTPEQDEIAVAEGWSIVVDAAASDYMKSLAKDLQDYLLVSMDVSVYVRFAENAAAAAREPQTILITTAGALAGSGWDQATVAAATSGLKKERSYRLVVDGERIVICGCDERGAGQGCYHLEDLMNMREAPFVKKGNVLREPHFSPRMTHSGWGLDEFPDAHLNAIAHAGMDSILVFVKDIDHSPKGHLNFNDLVDRAERYGLDVYMYSYLESLKHPGDADALEYYESTYGAIFAACPRFKGVVLVGESVEFPSKDENTSREFREKEPSSKVPADKPSPGWWPCCDYPEWLNMLKKVIRTHSPEADIVFWTYNWGWAPEEARLELIRNVPEDITLLVTFEMFEQQKQAGVTHVTVDYTLSFEGPGVYFASEAQAAKERGLKLYTMSNTGGLTWDFGVIPYEPMPYQWLRRFDVLLQAKADWGLSGLMESHHYGFWPSFIGELSKQAFWSPDTPLRDYCAALARRDYGSEAAPLVLEAWERWSEAIRHYIPTNEDQYGPFRIGPSYPLLFQQKIVLPAAWFALWGNRIVHIEYKPSDFKVRELGYQSLGPSRIDSEIASLRELRRLLEQGLASLERAIALMPTSKRLAGEDLRRLGEFMSRSALTALHAKQWWKLKQRLLGEPDPNMAGALLGEMKRVARLEIANAEATIPLTAADSRLGWEPSMDYMTDPEHLCWKIAQVEGVIKELDIYGRSLKLTDGYIGAGAARE